MFELFVLFAFFIGLYFGGGQSQAAAMAAIGGGFWATWFWYGVIGAGMLVPLGLNAVSPAGVRHNKAS